MPLIDFGTEVKDTVTGFRGFVVSYTVYMDDTTTYDVQPSINGCGELPSPRSFDSARLDVIPEDERFGYL